MMESWTNGAVAFEDRCSSQVTLCTTSVQDEEGSLNKYINDIVSPEETEVVPQGYENGFNRSLECDQNEAISAEENKEVPKELEENITETPAEVTTTDYHSESLEKTDTLENEEALATKNDDTLQDTLEVTNMPSTDEDKARVLDEEKKGDSRDEEEENIPLSRLRHIEPTPEPEENPKTKEDNCEEEKEKVHLTSHPFSHIRGRNGLRGGSPLLNASFTVRSEPASPSGFGFPRLRKADAQISLVQAVTSRKRARSEFTPDSPSANTKRQCHSWLGFNLARWWRGDVADEGEDPAVPHTAAEALAEPATTDVRSPRSCSLM